jgi:PiT family inorganic phosphate transporter
MTDLLSLPALIGLVVVALSFDFLNGLHDTANSIATLVSTRMLQPRYAVIWAAFFNFVAFLFFGVHVARTIGVGIVSADVIDPRVIFGALMGAIVWNLLTWWRGIPSSSSHALIGGLLGAGITKAGIVSVVWSGVLTTGAFIVLSPMFGFFLALLLVLAVSWGFVRTSPRAVEGVFQWLQFAAASMISLGHGGNDAQKTMGIIAVLLFSQGQLSGDFYVPFWVVITCQAAMALGTLVGGWRIVQTVGSRITRLTPVQGCCASTGGAVMLFAATYLGIPVSTTHTVTGSVIGVGAARKVSAVRWRIATDIVIAWIITVPASALMAAGFYLLSGFIPSFSGSIGYLLFEILMGFISFGSVAILFASLFAIVIWLLSKIAR